jgi:hypothetical protein
VTKNWHAPRLRHAATLIKIEGQSGFDDLQQMLAAAHTLSSERRLSRFVYVARKPNGH